MSTPRVPMVPPALEPSMFTILVVDDEETNRDMLSRRLERQGYVTMVAAGGAAALDKIASAGCDLVLLDVMMPGIDGVQVLAEVRKHHAPSELPVIMASARTDTDVITECLKLGANDYVTKPLDFRVVLARVETQLTMKAAVEALKESEARFRMMAELSTDLISIHAPDGTFRFASPAALELLGYGPGELQQVKLFDLVLPADRAKLPDTPAELPEDATLLIRMVRRDGTPIWCEIRSRLVRGTRTGRITDIQCTTRDVSFYIDAWQGHGPPVGGRGGSAVRRTTHPEVEVTIRVHDEHIVSEQPPPVRRRGG